MAGNWIKMRHDLYDAPEVRKIARAAGLDRDQVVGKLYRFWSWADRHGHNGAVDAEIEDIDEQVGLVGFGAALVSVGWLVSQSGGIVIPHWERHFSDSAKVRALGQNRAEKHRTASRNAPSVTDSQHGVTLSALPEERREDNPHHPPREASQNEAGATLRAAWAALVKAGHGKPYTASGMPQGFHDRLGEPGWLDEALRAIQHLPRCRYFDKPATLHQMCGAGFVAKVLGGQYDDAKPTKATRFQEDKPPAAGFQGDDAARFEATRRRELAKLKAAEVA
jgi:hypothetical protein